MSNVGLMVTRLSALVAGLAVGWAAQGERAGAAGDRLAGIAGLCLMFLVGAAMFALHGRLPRTPLFGRFTTEAYRRVRLNLMAPLLTVGLAFAFEVCTRLKVGFISRGFGHVGRYSLEIYLMHSGVSDLVSGWPLPRVARLVSLLALSYLAARLLALLSDLLMRFLRRRVAPLLFTPSGD